MIILTEDGYQFRVGNEWRTLKDPHGPASPAQLARLNKDGRLQVVGKAERISKLSAAREIDKGKP